MIFCSRRMHKEQKAGLVMENEMTIDELCRLIKLPQGVTDQLKEYQNSRKTEIPQDIKEKLFKRDAWDKGIEELKTFLGEDPYSMKILLEQLDLVCEYSYKEYVKRAIPMSVFADTFGFVTRFVTPTRDVNGKYSYNWAWWLQRQITLLEFRIGSLEFEFVEAEGQRRIEIHIPSDADMRLEALCRSIAAFVKFQKEYFPEWNGVQMVTETWMIMPELEDLLPADSKILRFKSLFDIDDVDHEQTWYMGWIFPGHTEADENLSEKTTLHRRLKEYLLSGKKFGIAKGHLVMDRVKKVLDEKLVSVVPEPRQLAFQETEFYAFVHFTVNTFTDREWGDGKESPNIFNPVKLDASQWVTAIKDAGMRGLILTCKHHDGFCLWPSRQTKHTVEYSPFGRDVVREVSEECHRQGIKFGVYLSPWDRNCKRYGTGKPYDDYFISQLTELLTDYGEVFSVWFDGACGEGENGKKQYYDWERYYQTIRSLQPNACINVCGPDIRWCGNEAGHTRKSEWSVVPERTRDTEKIASASQHEDNEEFRQRKISAWDEDLGSREALMGEEKLVWYPAEVNTSIRPGWFWHESENERVRSLEDLMHVYYSSVGGNATFLLNIPPTQEGLFHENDVRRLKEIGEYLRGAFAVNLMEKAEVLAPEPIRDLVNEENYDRYYKAETGTDRAEILIRWETPVNVGNVVLKENIRLSQRVEAFRVEAKRAGKFESVYEGTVIGYKRIIPFKEGIVTDSLRIVITDSRMEPTLAFLGIYEHR